jgi:hypothetical protein
VVFPAPAGPTISTTRVVRVRGLLLLDMLFIT